MNKLRVGIAHEKETLGTERGQRKQEWSQIQVFPAAWVSSADELMCKAAQGNEASSLISAGALSQDRVETFLRSALGTTTLKSDVLGLHSCNPQ